MYKNISINNKVLLSQTSRFFGSDLEVMGIPLEIQEMHTGHILRSFLLLTLFAFALISDISTLIVSIIILVSYFYISPMLSVIATIIMLSVIFTLYATSRQKEFLYRVVFLLSVFCTVNFVLSSNFFVEYTYLINAAKYNYFSSALFLVLSPYIFYPFFRGLLFVLFRLIATYTWPVSLYKVFIESMMIALSCVYFVVANYALFILISGNELSSIFESQVPVYTHYAFIGMALLAPILKIRVKSHKKTPPLRGFS